METFSEEKIEYITKYKASDGTVFNDRAECEKYEKTAKCVIKSKFDKLVINRRHSSYDLFDGCDDTTVLVVKMKDKDDMDTVLQMLYIENPHLKKSENENVRKMYLDQIESAFKDNGILLWGENCDGDYFLYDSRYNIVERFMNLDKE